MVIIKRTVTVILILTLVLLCGAEALLGSNYRFKNEPSYVTANRWQTSDGKKAELNALCTDETLTVRLKVKKRFENGTYLIIRKKDLKITAFTKNKILYKTDEENGECFALIPVWEALKGEDITLLLEPAEHKTGSVEGTVKLQSKNDFFFSLLYENKNSLIAVFILFVMLIISICRKRLYGALTVFTLIIYILTAGSLYQFLFGIHGICRAVNIISFISFVYFFLNYIIIAIKKIICYNS